MLISAYISCFIVGILVVVKWYNINEKIFTIIIIRGIQCGHPGSTCGIYLVVRIHMCILDADYLYAT